MSAYKTNREQNKDRYGYGDGADDRDDDGAMMSNGRGNISRTLGIWP